MGSPVSPVVANIFMEHVEEEAVRTSPHEVRCWKRYVDDTFCFLGRANVDPVLNHLNSIHSVYSGARDWREDTFSGYTCTTA